MDSPKSPSPANDRKQFVFLATNSYQTKERAWTETPPNALQCLSVRKNCSTCKDGICSACNSGFKLRKNKKRCVPCGSVKKGKRIDHPQCGSDGCGKGCKNCTEDGSLY
ncbi:hypothetical protein OS493_017410 [Desmophyllum pertusum]|uniref:Uncharacterized protein n=1 Tax=Desmophyllum pertusum TaxID=174260 RepID=A0A9X0A1G2_9CNID|nr:hypothetical protein OS493_017410 [Desmophyllum pertusum]